MQGHDIAALLGYRTALKKFISYLIIPIAMKKHRDLVSGMYYDLVSGKKCEADLINGVAVKYGARVCRPAVLNGLVVKTAHRIEDGELSVSEENLSVFREYI